MQIGHSYFLDLEQSITMEIEENKKIVIAKPVACRPHASRFKPFSEFLSGAVNSSPPSVLSEPAVTRPRNIVEAAKRGCAARDTSEKGPETNATLNVVYKPIPKLVSNAKVPPSANSGGAAREIGARTEPSSQVNLQTDPISEFNVPPQLEDNDKLSFTRDRASYDGHNWRKYGQKHVKGSEYPRSYYKCTYPNCPMKKVEKTLNGLIAEIVYKGEHNHSKLQPLPSMKESKSRDEARPEHKDITESTLPSPTPIYSPVAAPSSSNNSLGLSGEFEEGRAFLDIEGDEFKSKRTKCVNRSRVGEALLDPEIVVKKNSDCSVTGDGFRWRKYGQKVVKGKTYPRSYYRCTTPDCGVRKYVERMSDDPTTFITTYEGKHNHPVPKTSSKSKSSPLCDEFELRE